ncbi:NepR family anti-sigma factor [Ancylobacter sp. WKF20]|uniref:NepR family anti-sigma factor n=1 Tax=Ancylobacter sp. WKF20 TaxID=3039801 RepID=UPI00243427B6|nr:NepR family anti-sigma factor [Ancylobacter sp. WKF20]WGD32483.1 NepR family anti-sigma factor [Ancylobacter sp. WKF20]
MAGGAGSALGTDIQGKIGQHLRAMYDDVVRQGVPDRFLDLLSQLDQPAKDPKAGEGGGEK